MLAITIVTAFLRLCITQNLILMVVTRTLSQFFCFWLVHSFICWWNKNLMMNIISLAKFFLHWTFCKLSPTYCPLLRHQCLQSVHSFTVKLINSLNPCVLLSYTYNQFSCQFLKLYIVILSHIIDYYCNFQEPRAISWPSAIRPYI